MKIKKRRNYNMKEFVLDCDKTWVFLKGILDSEFFELKRTNSYVYDNLRKRMDNLMIERGYENCDVYDFMIVSIDHGSEIKEIPTKDYIHQLFSMNIENFMNTFTKDLDSMEGLIESLIYSPINIETLPG